MKDIQRYSDDALDIISATNFLPVEEIQSLKAMQVELQDTFEKRQIWRTETEMRISVLNDLHFPTKASKYWQCVREQSVFFEQLILLSFDYRRNEVAIKRATKRMETASDFDREEAEIDLDECLFKRKNMQVLAKDRMRELKLWSQLKTEFDDGSFDTKDVNAHQLESYFMEFKNEMHLINAQTGISERKNIQGKTLSAAKEMQRRG